MTTNGIVIQLDMVRETREQTMTDSTKAGTVTAEQFETIRTLLDATTRTAAVEYLGRHTGYSFRTVERRASAEQASELIEKLRAEDRMATGLYQPFYAG